MKPLLAFLLRRLVWSLTLVVGVGSLAFFVTRALPGDPARLIVGPRASAADVERARVLHGLDRPLPIQFVRYWQRLVHHPSSAGEHRSCKPLGPMHLDLGTSHRHQKSVVAVLGARAPRTLELALATTLVQLVVGLGLATLAARRRGSVIDQVATASSLLAVSTPTFVLGVLLQYVLAYRLGWLPLDGGGSDRRALVLPALTLGLYGAAFVVRLAREELGAALESDYASAAAARGASPLRVLFVHGWRNALGAMLPLLLLELGALVGGAVVTEKLFRWPGLGSLTVDAVLYRDAPIVFGVVMVSAAGIAAASFALDVLRVALDPRLRRRAT
ncbi:MAG: ABC transporter permease [Deltaproteobacteria bacterium]|nr:ABC transporter permease [Deltaproteobacteria bacterium]